MCREYRRVVMILWSILATPTEKAASVAADLQLCDLPHCVERVHGYVDGQSKVVV